MADEPIYDLSRYAHLSPHQMGRETQEHIERIRDIYGADVQPGHVTLPGGIHLHGGVEIVHHEDYGSSDNVDNTNLTIQVPHEKNRGTTLHFYRDAMDDSPRVFLNRIGGHSGDLYKKFGDVDLPLSDPELKTKMYDFINHPETFSQEEGADAKDYFTNRYPNFNTHIMTHRILHGGPDNYKLRQGGTYKYANGRYDELYRDGY
jgi:hypothetical protein